MWWTTSRPARCPTWPEPRLGRAPAHRPSKMDHPLGRVVDLIRPTAPEVIFHLAAQADVRRSVPTRVDADVNLMAPCASWKGPGGPVGPSGVAASVDHLTASPTLGAAAEGVAAPGARCPPTACRRSGHRLLVAYQRAVLTGVRRGWPGQRLRPTADPHGGGRRGHLRRAPAPREPATIFGDGEQTRDYVYVRRVVDAFVRRQQGGRPDLQHRDRTRPR